MSKRKGNEANLIRLITNSWMARPEYPVSQMMFYGRPMSESKAEIENVRHDELCEESKRKRKTN